MDEIDNREEFGDYVIDNFVDEYMAGRTPNPCVLCNTHIKWAALLKRADQLDCEFIATGHYAVMKLGMNHPMGPLTLADLIGLDVVLFVMEVLQRDLAQ